MCEWEYDSRELGAQGGPVLNGTLGFDRAVPVFPMTVATVTVRLTGVDNGWSYAFLPVDPEGRFQAPVAAHQKPPSPGRTVSSDTGAHVLVAPEAGWGMRFSFSRSYDARVEGGGTFAGATLAPSDGTFTVVYVAEPLPEGVAPSRPAATRDDPHVREPDVRDAARPEFDLRAAWFDDARVGDGLAEAHLALTAADGYPELDAAWWSGGASLARYSLRFAVQDQDYFLQWDVTTRDGELRLGCEMGRATAVGDEPLTQPLCRVDAPNATLVASFLEASVGSPGPGVPFTGMRADVATFRFGEERVEDEMRGERYPFALGGPPVWDVLNPRLKVPEPPEAAWFEDPLSSAHLPDTLQVAGAAAAFGTFVAGLVVVRRHRALTRRILKEVDDVARAHAADARGALLALGRLQGAVSDLFHEGRITEQQYQVVVQRIALEATKFALRRELGLDDGEPGEAVPVASGPARP